MHIKESISLVGFEEVKKVFTCYSVAYRVWFWLKGYCQWLFYYWMIEWMLHVCYSSTGANWILWLMFLLLSCLCMLYVDWICFLKVNFARFPILASMARDVLAILISMVAFECAFSVGWRILSNHHCCLTHNGRKTCLLAKLVEITASLSI